MAAIQNAGIAIDWAGAVLGVIPEDTEEAVAASPVGSNGVSFLPYLTGERTPHLDAELSGAWSGLRPTTTRADLVRSVFEGVAFALRDALDALGTHGTARALAGGGSTAVLAGGGSTSGWWRQMLADTLEITLVPHNVADASVRGAGLLAWASVGVNVDPAAAVSRHAPIEPSSTSRPAYDRARQRFLDAFCAAAIHDRHRHRSTDTTN
jgi:xylulokinase